MGLFLYIWGIMSLKQFSNNFDAFVRSIKADINDTYQEMEMDFVQANQKALQKGELSTGVKMRPLAWASYANEKQSMGSLAAQLNPSLPDLYYKGGFYRGMKIENLPSWIYLLSTDSKSGKLEAMYSDDIFGVQDRFITPLQSKFITILTNKIDAKILQLFR